MDASCSCHTTLSLPFYTDPDSKRELNFYTGYLSLLYFWLFLMNCHLLHMPRLPFQLASNISMNACVQVFTNSTALNPK